MGRQRIPGCDAEKRQFGVVKIHLYRPFPLDAFIKALPKTVTSIAVLDRTKEPGSLGEPLYLDVFTTYAKAFSDGHAIRIPKVIGGRYGLSSKDFDPSMAKAVFDALKHPEPRHGFTVGIVDDVSRTSLSTEAGFDIESPEVVRALFYGLGADGTGGARRHWHSLARTGGAAPPRAVGYRLRWGAAPPRAVGSRLRC